MMPYFVQCLEGDGGVVDLHCVVATNWTRHRDHNFTVSLYTIDFFLASGQHITWEYRVARERFENSHASAEICCHAEHKRIMTLLLALNTTVEIRST